MILELRIKREPGQDVQTLGKMEVYDPITRNVYLGLSTVELPWKDNQQKISCIPPARYNIEKFNSPKHGLCFLIKDVPGRTMCEIHAANYSRELLGCIAPGLGNHVDIDKDGLKDVVNSKKAMEKLLALLPEKSFLTIENEEKALA